MHRTIHAIDPSTHWIRVHRQFQSSGPAWVFSTMAKLVQVGSAWAFVSGEETQLAPNLPSACSNHLQNRQQASCRNHGNITVQSRAQESAQHTARLQLIDLMPDKRAGSWRGMRPSRGIAVYAKSVFSTQFLRHFYFPFPPTFEIAFFEKKRASHSIFLHLYVKHCFRFKWVGVWRSSATTLWKSGSAPCEWRSRYLRSQISEALLPFLFFFFFFACFPIFLKKAFSERKITLKIFPKKDEGTLHGSINDERDFWNRRSSKEGNLRLFGHRRKKIPLYLYFLALLYFLHTLLMVTIANHCLKKKGGGRGNRNPETRQKLCGAVRWYRAVVV